MSTPVLLCMVVSMQYVCVCEVSEVDTFSRVGFWGLEGASCGWVVDTLQRRVWGGGKMCPLLCFCVWLYLYSMYLCAK